VGYCSSGVLGSSHEMTRRSTVSPLPPRPRPPTRLASPASSMC
jgi:hypothetical protein